MLQDENKITKQYTKKCLNCESVYVTANNGAKYCSKRCRDKAFYKKRVQNKSGKPCLQCGTVFYPTNYSTATCSESCRLLRQKDKKREYYQNFKSRPYNPNMPTTCTKCKKTMPASLFLKDVLSTNCVKKVCKACAKMLYPSKFASKNTNRDNSAIMIAYLNKIGKTEKNCCKCGKTFSSYKSEYCSVKCYNSKYYKESYLPRKRYKCICCGELKDRTHYKARSFSLTKEFWCNSCLAGIKEVEDNMIKNVPPPFKNTYNTLTTCPECRGYSKHYDYCSKYVDF